MNIDKLSKDLTDRFMADCEPLLRSLHFALADVGTFAFLAVCDGVAYATSGEHLSILFALGYLAFSMAGNALTYWLRAKRAKAKLAGARTQ